MPTNIKLKVFFYISIWFIAALLMTYILGVAYVALYVLVSLYLLYKIYPKFDFVSDIQFNKNKKLVALTFDDGPTRGFTEEILKILKTNNVTATFFVIGSKAEQNKELLRYIIDSDCELGAHTSSHTKLHNSSYKKIRHEIEPTILLLEKLYSHAGISFKRIFRAPHGFKNIALKLYLRKNSIKLIPWTRGVWDTDAPGSDWIFKMATTKPKNNEIILLHDGLGLHEVAKRQKEGLLSALPKIIDFYKNHGYTFVKASDLIKQ